MTDEERDIISRFVARVGGAPQAGAFGQGTAGGAGGQPPAPLPPVDREADEYIAQQFARYPEARYRITQMAFVQEAALAEAQNRLRRMQWELEQAHSQQAQAGATPGAAPQQQQSRGFFGGLFGGGQPHQQAPQYQQPPYQQSQYRPGAQYAPPPPQYPPSYQPGMFQRGGSGFLGSALTTAAGVAGGVVVGNALMDMFSGHGGGLGGGFGGERPMSETIVNNYGTDPAAGGADPWAAGAADPGAGSDPWASGGAAPDPGAAQDPGWSQGGGWDQGGADPGLGGGTDPGWDAPDPGGFDDDTNV